jgi:hypothetical protein
MLHVVTVPTRRPVDPPQAKTQAGESSWRRGSNNAPRPMSPRIAATTRIERMVNAGSIGAIVPMLERCDA